MTNLEYRSPFHWSTAWARRVGARFAVLVDLITAHCHEVLGVSSSTIAEAINRQIVVPLVRHNYARDRMKLGIVKQTIDYYLRVPLIRASLPKWWQSFAGYETWVHDGTCGHAKDWRWLLEHWPSLATGYRAPFLRAGQSMRETAKILVKFGFYADDYLRCVEELKKKLIEFVEGPSIVLPNGINLEYVMVPPRRFGYSLIDVLSKPGTYVMQARSHGKREGMRQYEEMLKAEARAPMLIPASLLKPEHVEAGDRESTRAELGVRDFPGFARRYFDTGHMKRSARMGENAGINAESGELTVWLPEPEEAEATQEPLEGEIVPQSADLELSGPVWGPSPTREFFRQMRARRKEHRVKGSWRVVITVPAGDIPAEERNDEAAELWCQQIAAEVLDKVSVPGEDPRANVLILATDEAGHIEKFPLVGADEAGTIKSAEAAEPPSGDEIKEDGTAPDLEEDAEEATE